MNERAKALTKENHTTILYPLLTAKETRRPREGSQLFAGVYSALFTLVALAGTAGGLLFPQTAIGWAVAGRECLLNSSLFGIFFEIMRGSIIPPPLTGTGISLLPALLYISLFVLMGVIALSFFFTILALLCPKTAKSFCVLNGICVLFAYAVPTVFAYLLLSLEQNAFSHAMIDFPSALVVGACVLLLFLFSIGKRRIFALFNLLLLLLSFTGAGALLSPNSPTFADGYALLLGTGEKNFSLSVILQSLFSVTVFNCAYAVLRLFAGRGRFDVIRFGAQTALSVAYFALSCAMDTAFALTALRSLPMIALLLSPTLALFFSEISLAFSPKKRIKRYK